MSALHILRLEDGSGDVLEVRDSLTQPSDVVVQVNGSPAVIVELGDLGMLSDFLTDAWYRRSEQAEAVQVSATIENTAEPLPSCWCGQNRTEACGLERDIQRWKEHPFCLGPGGFCGYPSPVTEGAICGKTATAHDEDRPG